MSVSITIEADAEQAPQVVCEICITDYPSEQMYTLESCHCQFCHSCMRKYVEIMITEGMVLAIPCPDASCNVQGTLYTSEIAQIVDTEMFDRYNRFKFEREVDTDPSRTWCPQAACETICHVPQVTDSNTQQMVVCPKCGLQFCSRCKCPWHVEVTCDEALQIHGGPSDGIPFTADIDSNIKRCPVCQVPIERDAGCAQMMCKNCKHVFCWYCLQSLDDDFLLRHFDKGPCKDKLGHTRASLLWHRVQVIGIFASFALLLLLALPFLLLAAPCLVCCKCKACRRFCTICFNNADPPAPPSTTASTTTANPVIVTTQVLES